MACSGAHTRCQHIRPPPQCLQYKSDQQIDLKKLEALNNLMFLGMTHGPDAAAGACGVSAVGWCRRGVCVLVCCLGAHIKRGAPQIRRGKGRLHRSSKYPGRPVGVVGGRPTFCGGV